jgi:hypothetical protein
VSSWIFGGPFRQDIQTRGLLTAGVGLGMLIPGVLLWHHNRSSFELIPTAGAR